MVMVIELWRFENDVEGALKKEAGSCRKNGEVVMNIHGDGMNLKLFED
jgi:hypothetical protein